MSQFQTYRDRMFVSQLNNVEKEILAFKGKQRYGALQIQPRESRCEPVYSSPTGWDGGHELRGILTFRGVNVNRLARGQVYHQIFVDDSRMEDDASCGEFVINSAGQEPNIIRWLVYGFCIFMPVPFSEPIDKPYTSSFNVVFKAMTNMEGVLTYEAI